MSNASSENRSRGRWTVSAAVLGIPLPAVSFIAAESAAERSYVDRYGGDRPWDDLATTSPPRALVTAAAIVFDRARLGEAGLDQLAHRCVVALCALNNPIQET